MRTSDSITNLAAALLKAQAAIEHVTKDKVGKVQTKTGREYEYKYSDLSSVIEAVKGPLNANGLVFLQSPGGDSTGVSVTTRILHTSGEWAETTIYIPVQMGTAQAYGSAITYGKRYGLQSLVGLPSDDDDGQAASDKPKAAKQAYDKPNTAKQVAVDAFESLPDEDKDFLRSHASELGRIFQDKGDMYGYIERQNFDTEQKLALWSLLDSKVRSEFKRQQQEHLKRH